MWVSEKPGKEAVSITCTGHFLMVGHMDILRDGQIDAGIIDIHSIALASYLCTCVLHGQMEVGMVGQTPIGWTGGRRGGWSDNHWMV